MASDDCVTDEIEEEDLCPDLVGDAGGLFFSLLSSFSGSSPLTVMSDLLSSFSSAFGVSLGLAASCSPVSLRIGVFWRMLSLSRLGKGGGTALGSILETRAAYSAIARSLLSASCQYKPAYQSFFCSSMRFLSDLSHATSSSLSSSLALSSLSKALSCSFSFSTRPSSCFEDASSSVTERSCCSVKSSLAERRR